ncbi:MAG: hypothetical protein Q8R37_01865 [Nanoarchaeota archaeon]|nr:hypothetical protein [Nanoarchaeota archaeon]
MDETNPLQYHVQNEEQKRQLAAAIEEGNATAAGLRQLLNHFYKQSRSPENVTRTGIIPDEKTYLIWQEIGKYDDKSLIELVKDFVEPIEKIEETDVIKIDLENQTGIETAIIRPRELMPIEKANQQLKAVSREYRRLQDNYRESKDTNNRLTKQYRDLEAELEAERNAHQQSHQEHEAILYSFNDSLQNSEAVLNRATIEYQLQLEDAIDEAKGIIDQLITGQEQEVRNNQEEITIYQEAHGEAVQEMDGYEQRIKQVERNHAKTKRKLETIVTINEELQKPSQCWYSLATHLICEQVDQKSFDLGKVEYAKFALYNAFGNAEDSDILYKAADLGNFLFELERHDLAEAVFNEITKAQPENCDAWSKLAAAVSCGNNNKTEDRQEWIKFCEYKAKNSK